MQIKAFLTDSKEIKRLAKNLDIQACPRLELGPKVRAPPKLPDTFKQAA